MSEKLCERGGGIVKYECRQRVSFSYPVQEEECGEVGSMEGMQQIDKLGTVDGI